VRPTDVIADFRAACHPCELTSAKRKWQQQAIVLVQNRMALRISRVDSFVPRRQEAGNLWWSHPAGAEPSKPSPAGRPPGKGSPPQGVFRSPPGMHFPAARPHFSTISPPVCFFHLPVT
jgi:hypothetical protein